MSQGRIVRVHRDDTGRSSILKTFNVGLRDEDAAIAAVLERHPEFRTHHLEATESLSSTAVAFLDLQLGEVKDRLAVL